MSGYSSLNAAMYCSLTGEPGVYPHQTISPDVAISASPPPSVEVSGSSPEVSAHAAKVTASTATIAVPAALFRSDIWLALSLLIVETCRAAGPLVRLTRGRAEEQVPGQSWLPRAPSSLIGYLWKFR